ncbi:MAG: DNA methylase [Clostridiales bacterium]|nr:DNA methylase [Clostridiales bacterium]
MQRSYIAIDLKSFYASVECVERGLDPLNTNLVVADPTRTEKTICLAVSPSLKSYGIPGRARLFEVIQKVEQVNQERKYRSADQSLRAKSYFGSELVKDLSLAVDFIIATPQMAKYMQVSAKIYETYLKYVAPEDIFAYSVDEVFIDATGYLKTYDMPAHDFARMLIQDVLRTTGITATAGIGTNMYLCKVAMDIEAKHIPADKDGVRIAELTEQKYRESLWDHQPLTDFWRVGRGIAARIEKLGMRTMGDIARCSLDRKAIGLLYSVLGKNAELLIDHAWGIEPTTIADVKSYQPKNNSISTGQVLKEPTDYATTKLIVWEMADALSMDLVEKGLVTDQIVLTIGYDRTSLEKVNNYQGEVKMDYYGRLVPKHAHGSKNLQGHTSSTKIITEATMELFEGIIDPALFSRRIAIAACNVYPEGRVPENKQYRQMSIFDLASPEKEAKSQANDQTKSRANDQTKSQAMNLAKSRAMNQAKKDDASVKERALQEAMLEIKKKYGKNAVVKVKNLSAGGTAIERNNQIGGHKA